MMPEVGYKPTNKYLPPRQTRVIATDDVRREPQENPMQNWLDRQAAE